jgi:hypothetical protein
MDKKLGVIVPYRNRYDQLISFKSAITNYLKSKNIDFELIIVEQDDSKLFNRGKLLNIGFKQAKKLKCDYIAFHDVDMLPIEVDYSYSEIPLLLATQRASFDEFFSSVILFPIEHFEKINGYSNEYWGWGFEDDDLLFRCKVNNIPLDKQELKVVSNHTSALKFNGYNAYVEGLYKPKDEATIFLSFEPQDLILNHETFDDEFIIFSLPKLDLKISYDSYSKYKVVINDIEENILYINSERLNPYKTNLCVTIGNNKIELYQDGIFLGETEYKELKNNSDRNFYLGKTFKGLIHNLAIYDKVLSDKEIKEISENRYFGLTYFSSSDYLKTYYEAAFTKNYQLIDLSENKNKGNIYNCEIVKEDVEISKILEIPFKRESLFTLLEHEDNGFVNGGWKDINTRYNQLKFSNEVFKGYINTKEDGLNNLHYKEYSNTKFDNETHIVVGI